MKLEAKIYKILIDKGIDILITGPSICFNGLINLVEERQQILHIPITREDESIGIASGAFTGGKRAVIVINETGLGNLIDAIQNLSDCCKIPVIILITPQINLDQGRTYEKNFTHNFLESIDIKRWVINSSKETNDLNEAIDYSREKNLSVAIRFENILEDLN